MSVASSAMSSISVVFEGREQTLEEALDSCMQGIQKRLNNLHMEMRRLAALTEQEIDEVEDFKESVEFEDNAFDLVSGMIRLLKEIPLMARDITGTAPAECKEWFAAHKEDRKVKLAAEEAEYKAATAKAKAELKARLKAEVAESKTKK